MLDYGQSFALVNKDKDYIHIKEVNQCEQPIDKAKIIFSRLSDLHEYWPIYRLLDVKIVNSEVYIIYSVSIPYDCNINDNSWVPSQSLIDQVQFYEFINVAIQNIQ